ncbi:putative NAD+ kinase Utr1 [Aspergillus clavatus NRRL 1]|uniref:NAD+ kinase Utr1, putative n=1 Tax=Aspergillus clavatus (strain ATCC 1007 / CBS 513.65 / DSM 816 / NCTC 3887 / NRRL 1 / QM 1276 / 107) TaxID=344612 RepID=A1CFK6_ASPCL|nr:NAD+ kinase Utr1, putative [Aspergillus clavatus NRRL 1]EAW11655.1 NAD+ kinase Utr1, putative [Aspergillus clavatus NRRL 1]
MSPLAQSDLPSSRSPSSPPPPPPPFASATSPLLRSDPQSPNSCPLETSTTVGASLLREYALHIDPSQSTSEIHVNESPSGLSKGRTNVPQKLELHPEEAPPVTSLPSSPFLSFRSSGPLGSQHRKNASSSDLIPRQTIMKALASRPSLCSSPNANTPLATSLGLLATSPNSSTPMDADLHRSTKTSSSQKLSAALSNLQLSKYLERSPSTAQLVLQSPCFFHRRFDDAVNIQKVLEEIADDEWLSHSRLVQTATGVREVSKQLQRRPIKRAVKNVMIVTKARDNRLVHLTRELAEWLLSTPRYGSDLGVNVWVDSKLRNSKRFDAAGLFQAEPRFEKMLHYWTPDLCWSTPEKFDLVLTLGGDGTVLFTSWLFQRIVPPVLCFSLGSLGFLTNFEFENYKSHLNAVMGEVGMRVNLRMRFTCTVFRKDRSKGAQADAVEEGEQFEVLNELVIDRGPSPYVSNLELYADNDLLTVVQADGCIFSTPTGSTAYSLSAGGSLIHPSIPGILLTPICPHTLSFRPMVLSDSLLLRIAVPMGSRSTAYCSFDGKGRVELRQGDYVTVEASQYPFPTVVSGSGEWFESVQRALRWNTRGAVQKSWNRDGDADLSGDEAEEEEWDIDTDAGLAGTDSGLGPSEDGESGTTSPMKRQMSLLNM